MLFNSYVFILLFLPVTWAGYFFLNRYKLVELGKIWLLASSLFFYGYWTIKFLPILLISIIFNYGFSVKLLSENRENQKRLFFYFALIFNLGLLGYFKYANFFLENIAALSGKNFEGLSIILPIGISFYTLQQVAYLVDVYQGLSEKRRFLDYALFVSFFPHITAGPIVHSDEMMPQYKSLRAKIFNPKNVSLGIFIFVVGLFKKVLIADTLSVWVNEGYSHAENLHFFSAWGTSLSYTLQLYFDFSGYSDMAVGIGLLFNLQLAQNFNSPLRAGNINDFWSHWHMTLTSFIRTYIFTPLVKIMPKSTFGYSMVAMFLAMTIAGIWHGAAWTYVIYGMVHGLAIVVHYFWKKRKKKMPHFLAWLLTFNFVNFTFIIFRARNFTEVGHVLKGMLGLQGLQIPKTGIKFLHEMGVKLGPYMTNEENLQLLLILAGFFIILKADNAMALQEKFEPKPGLATIAAVMFVLCLFGLNRVSGFIYLNF